jgi:histidinol-phosphate/aromatic aminotransferase/cobyric acid decarboxylase-like protein
VSVDVILASVTQATRIFFVCNPGNPTGTRIANTELARLRISLPSNVLLVIDQAYAEFDDQGHQGIFALLDHGNTVITRTFSKAYALAGQRVGWGAFPTEIAAHQ